MQLCKEIYAAWISRCFFYLKRCYFQQADSSVNKFMLGKLTAKKIFILEFLSKYSHKQFSVAQQKY